jgi:hypothetical protein
MLSRIEEIAEGRVVDEVKLSAQNDDRFTREDLGGSEELQEGERSP